MSNTFLVIRLFTIGITSAALSQLHPEVKFLIWIVFSIALIYLLSGWYLFKAYYPGGHPIILFGMGYFYAGVFIGSVFAATRWPFAETMMAISVFWAVAQTAVVIILRKKMPTKNFFQFLLEASLMLALTIFQIVRY
jgi:hypothetical protein